jgi:single-strand DNA-binding protein
MYQQITIIGNLGHDPSMKYLADGTPVTDFSVATNRRWNNADGTKGEEVVWFRVTAWRRLAETCNQYLSKGRQVMVVGRVKPARAWAGNDGEPRAQNEITAGNVIFLGSREDVGDVPDEPGEDVPEELEEEIPF